MNLYLLRLRHGRKKYYLLAATLLLVMTGCQTSAPTAAPTAPQTVTARPNYVMTVTLKPGDTRAKLEQRYGGEIVVWEPGVYAVLGLADTLPTDTLSAQADATGEDEWADLTVEESRDAFLAGGKVAWMSGRSRTWAGGKSRTWAGGKSRTWAGGLTELWSGGQYLWLPENTAIWQRVHLEDGQALAKNLGYNVKVAVIDTGIDLTHPALVDALAPASEWKDFFGHDNVPQEEGNLDEDGYGHGTNVAGIIRQIAPRATILPLRVLGPDGQGDVADLTAAIQWATNQGADIINLSLGSDEKIKAVEEAIKWANKQGVFVVASSGNTGDKSVTYPASKAGGKDGRLRTSVTSIDLSGVKSSFATYGKEVELAAPGERVFGPAPELSLAAWTGTSQAAPMASGALALALGEPLKVGRAKLADELMGHADDLYGGGQNKAYKDGLGKGGLNIKTFLENVL